jgi:hypothetical protein
MVPMLVRLAVADFRDRVRRPACAAILIAAVALGYLATPASSANWVVVQVGSYRGTYNSAYIGMIVALAGAIWLSLAGFYVVRNALSRDESTGVGRLLAATPLRTSAYLVAKFLSSVLVLASMLGVLAVTAVVMQLARGEDMAVDPVRLLSPFVLIALPLMALTAAAALLFETVPVLRTGFGNIVWFFLWSVVAIGGQSPRAPLGGIGVHSVVRSLAAAMAAQGIDPHRGGEFSLGLTFVDEPLRTFDWAGFDPSPEFLVSRLVLVLLALALVVLPALWFPRFDPARSAGQPSGAEGTGRAQDAYPGAHATAVPAAGPAAFQGVPRAPVRPGSPALRLLARCASWSRAPRGGGGPGSWCSPWSPRWPRRRPVRAGSCFRWPGSGPYCCGPGSAPSAMRPVSRRSSVPTPRHGAGSPRSGARDSCSPR